MTSSNRTYDPKVLREPGIGGDERNVWLRGLWMVVFAILLRFAGFVLAVATLIQFLWMLFGKETHAGIASFGQDMADWFDRVAKFQTGASDDRPFPFAPWGPRN